MNKAQQLATAAYNVGYKKVCRENGIDPSSVPKRCRPTICSPKYEIGCVDFGAWAAEQLAKPKRELMPWDDED
jgi:hypothetical protein